MKNKKPIWVVLRTLTFLIVGLFNTILIRPEDMGTWKNYVGYFLLALAIFEIVMLLIRFRKSIIEKRG